MKGQLEKIHPVLPVQNVTEALQFYVEKLGFELVFIDDAENPFYAGIRRDAIEIHLQWHDKKEWDAVERPMLRIVTKQIEYLFDEYKTKNVFHKNMALKQTSWGTKEFAFYDVHKNGLTFYTDI